MDPQQQGLSIFGLLAATILFGAYFFDDTPPSSSRPMLRDQLEHQVADSQDIPARLWQDPFDVVRKEWSPSVRSLLTSLLRGEPATPLDPDGQRFRDLQRDLCDFSAKGDITVMPVIVPGGGYPEDREWRRRTRYATVNGLIRSGYIPVQPGHIGYFGVPPEHIGPMTGDMAGPAKPNGVEHRASRPHPRERRQSRYPYEWFRDQAGKRSLLLVWVNEDLLGEQPILRMAKRYRLLLDLLPEVPDVRVIGPFSSATLDAMDSELSARLDEETIKAMSDISVYSPTATIDEMSLSGDPNNKKSFAERWTEQMPESKFIRTIPSDAMTSRTLIEELTARGVEPDCAKTANTLNCSHIALIGESDTSYARNLKKSFVRELGAREAIVKTVHQFGYLRGLDGRLPQESSDDSSLDGAADALDTRGARPSSVGEAHLDTVNRIAVRLRGLDESLRKSRSGRLRAIGVLGSDVYDKLLILQTLRRYFPGVVFFTTDLDARLLDADQLKWTRNLVIGSGYGLMLSPELQDDVPPFRSGYQSAQFLSTLLAVDERPMEMNALQSVMVANTPRVFEVGHAGAVDLSAPERGLPLKLALADKEVFLHPRPETSRGLDEDPSFWVWVVAIVLLSGLILLIVVGPIQDVVLDPRGMADGLAEAPYFLVPMALPFVVVAFLAGWNWDQLGEPLSFNMGVSVWPSELIRLLAGLMSILLVARALRAIEANRRRIEDEFFSGCTERHVPMCEIEPQPKARQSRLRCFYEKVSIYCWHRELRETLRDANPSDARGGRLCAVEVDDSASTHVNASKEWARYTALSGRWPRLARVYLPVALFMLVGYLIMNVLSGPAPVPVRSHEMLVLDKWIILGCAVFPFLVLLFLVLDAGRLSATLMDVLNERLTEWCLARRGLRHRMIHEFNAHPDDLPEWLDGYFGAELTENIGNMIWYPFLIMLLMTLSRLNWFDNWSMPFGLLVILAISLGLSAYSAIHLLRSAQKVRENALMDLRERRMKIWGGDGSIDDKNVRIAQIDELSAELLALNKGAFRSWTEQPLVKAAIMLLASLGMFAADAGLG